MTDTIAEIVQEISSLSLPRNFHRKYKGFSDYVPGYWNYLGKGCFAVAFEVKGFVVKIIKGKDTGYMEFIKGIKNLDNPNFPVIYKLIKFNSGHVAIITELLRHSDYFDYDTYESFRDEMRNIVYLINTNQPSQDDKYSDLIETLKLIVLLAKDKGIELNYDLHFANFMIRESTMELVCTDPFCVSNEFDQGIKSKPHTIKKAKAKTEILVKANLLDLIFSELKHSS